MSGPVMTQNRALATGPVAILWDIENCPVPSEVSAEDVAGNIRMAIKVHPAVKGAVTLFSAYGDFNHIPRRLREGFQRTGVNLIDVPNGRKDASDKAILVDMFLFALDYMPPCTILLISGDVDFSPALHKLGQRGYTIALAIPAGIGVSSVLYNAGRFVWDWPCLARGEGLVSAKSFLRGEGFAPGFSNRHRQDVAASYSGSGGHSSEDSDLVTEDEMYMYQKQTGYAPKQGLRERSQNSTGSLQNSSEVQLMGFSEGNQSCLNSVVSRPLDATNLGSYAHKKDQSMATNVELGSTDSWVQPGDFEGLKSQLIALVKSNGGNLPFLRLPSDYCKTFGRPLYLSEYGSSKLLHLIMRMSDVFIIKGQGCNRTLYLKQSRGQQQFEARGNADNAAAHGEDADQLITSSDDSAVNEDGNVDDESLMIVSDDQSDLAAVRLEVCKLEIQELLVSHACKIPLSWLHVLYRQRYGRELDLESFGFIELEVLLEKMQDLFSVKIDETTSKKLLVPKNS